MSQPESNQNPAGGLHETRTERTIADSEQLLQNAGVQIQRSRELIEANRARLNRALQKINLPPETQEAPGNAARAGRALSRGIASPSILTHPRELLS